MNHADITFTDNQFFLTGELNFLNAMDVLKKSEKNFKQHAELVFDFSGIKTSNSAGLALILEWIKWGKQDNKKVSFLHIPEKLMSIAKVGGVEKIINDN